MNEILSKIAECVEFGKINKAAPYPPQMKDQDGADELTRQALEEGVSAQDILTKGLMPGMEKIGIKFRENKVFVRQVLMAAKAMSTALVHLKPYFLTGEVKQKGTFIIGTVEGDLHDIGKNLVSMYDIAKSYIESGADMVETNSFGGTSFKLERYGLGDKVFELNKAAAELSRKAAGDKFVLGSVGPTGNTRRNGETCSGTAACGCEYYRRLLRNNA
ncbi:MAG: B12-binding domain-containing protein [Draconibacterium sp.]